MNYFLFVSIGNDFHKNETLYSIESLRRTIKVEDEVKIILYTDNPNFFTPFFVNYERLIIEKIEKSIINKWKKELDCSQYVKLKVIELLQKKYIGKVLFIESDVFFIKSIINEFEKINKYTFVAYNSLCTLEEITSYTNISDSHKSEIFNQVIELNGEYPNHSWIIYDFCILGFDSSNISLIKNAKKLLVELYSITQNDGVGNIIFSIIMQKNQKNRIRTLFSNHITFHYQSKEYIRLLIGYLMDLMIPEDFEAFLNMKIINKLGNLSNYGICSENLQAFGYFFEALNNLDFVNKNNYANNKKESEYFGSMFKQFYKAYLINKENK